MEDRFYAHGHVNQCLLLQGLSDRLPWRATSRLLTHVRAQKILFAFPKYDAFSFLGATSLCSLRYQSSVEQGV